MLASIVPTPGTNPRKYPNTVPRNDDFIDLLNTARLRNKVIELFIPSILILLMLTFLLSAFNNIGNTKIANTALTSGIPKARSCTPNVKRSCPYSGCTPTMPSTQPATICAALTQTFLLLDNTMTKNTETNKKNLKLFFQVTSNIVMMFGSINSVKPIANMPPRNDPSAVLVMA